MNVAATPKHASSAFVALFHRWLPERPSALAMLWLSFPILLLLLTIGVSTFKPAPFTAHLPFMALPAFVLVLRYRKAGISIAYVALSVMLLWRAQPLSSGEMLWQMGIFFNVALTLYITLLAAEEIEVCLDEVHNRAEIQHLAANQIESELRVQLSCNQAKEEELEVAIEKLKSEAELRRIERVHIESRIETMQSEIEHAHQEKQALLQEAGAARSVKAEADGRLQAVLFELEHSRTAHHQLLAEVVAAQQAILLLQQKKPALIEKIVEKEVICQGVDPKEVEELHKALNKTKGLHNQLQSQFQDKADVLSQTRQELFVTQGKLDALERETLHAALAPESEEVRALEQSIALLTADINQLEEEVASLEALVTAFIQATGPLYDPPYLHPKE